MEKERKILWFGVILLVVSAVIMIFSKLFPIIPSPWSLVFCTNMNDLLFGLFGGLFSSLIVALIMYYYTDFKPRKDFSEMVKPVLEKKIKVMHETYNYVFRQFGILGDLEKADEKELARMMKEKNLADPMDDSGRTYGKMLQETMIELRRIISEFLIYLRYLENDQVVKLEEIVNMAYSGLQTAKKCTTDSSEIKKSIITGNVLMNFFELYERDSFVDDVFIPSYKQMLELEKSF